MPIPMPEFDIERMRSLINAELERLQIAAKRLSKDAGLNESALRDILNRVADPRVKTLLKISDHLDIPPGRLMGLEVPVCGLVGAEGIVHFFRDDETLEMVDLPPITDKNVVALRVVTDLLAPLHRAGDLLFISRSHDGVNPFDLGHEVIALTLEGIGYLRELDAGSEEGTFTLRPFAGRTIRDVRLAWAARVLSTIRFRNEAAP
jgi:transcriptional regulator with XRE-family HTH domain